MNIENTAIQMRKGILEYCILLIIERGKEVYASDLIEELKLAQIIVVEGTLYPLLSRLHKSEILAYSWRESTSGPPRKYYRLALPQGEIFLRELDQTWHELLTSVTYIVGKETPQQPSFSSTQNPIQLSKNHE